MDRRGQIGESVQREAVGMDTHKRGVKDQVHASWHLRYQHGPTSISSCSSPAPPFTHAPHLYLALWRPWLFPTTNQVHHISGSLAFFTCLEHVPLAFCLVSFSHPATLSSNILCSVKVPDPWHTWV